MARMTRSVADSIKALNPNAGKCAGAIDSVDPIDFGYVG
jgi:hypothetical protein